MATNPPLTLSGAGSLGKDEDSAHVSGDTGVMALAVRQDTQADFGADGDYVPLSINADGELRVTTGGGGGTQYAEDSAHSSGDTGTMMLAVRNDAVGALAGSDGDYAPLQVNASGELYAEVSNAGTFAVQVDSALPTGSNAIGKLAANSGVDIGDVDVTSVIPGTGATSLGKAEDAAHSSGDTGVMTLAVRSDADGALGGADGDYAPLQVCGAGALKVQRMDPVASTSNTTTANVGGTSAINDGTGITDSDTTITVDDGSVFADGQTVLIGSEYVVIGTVSTNDLTGCTRGAFGSTASAHADDAAVTGAFVGTGERVYAPDVMVSLKSSVAGTEYFEFSNDNVEWDRFPVNGFAVAANIHEFHGAVKGARYFRVVFVTSSAAASSSFRIYTYYGAHRQGNAPLNQSVSADADSVTVRAVATAADVNGTYANKLRSGVDDDNSTTAALAAPTTLNDAGGISNSDTTITVTSATGYSAGQTILIESEYITIGAVSSNDLTGCTRGAFGSEAASHADTTAVTAVFVGAWSDITSFAGITVSGTGAGVSTCPGTLAMQFSHNGSTAHRTVSVSVTDVASMPPRTLGNIAQYFRVVYTNTTIAQTSFTLQTMYHEQQVALVSRLDQAIGSNTDVQNVRAITAGQQPDGDFVNAAADGEAFSTTSALASSGVYTSSWVDTDGWNSIEIFVTADVASARQGIQVQFTDDTQGAQTVRATRKFTFSAFDIAEGGKIINLPPWLDGFRVSYTNNSSTGQSSFYLSATLKTNQANTAFNAGRAVLTSDFATDVALGAVDNYMTVFIEGRNPDTDTSETADITDDATNGIGDFVYAGQPTADPSETLVVVSGSLDDTSGGSGARTVKITGLTSLSDEEYTEETVTMNGTTAVETTNNFVRVIDFEILTAGSGGTSAGEISVTNKTTTDNVYVDIPAGQNKAHMGVYTVPASHKLVVRKMTASIVRSNGSAGSAYVRLLVRDTQTSNAVYIPKCTLDVQTGSRFVQDFLGGLVVDAQHDIKCEVTDVSDTNTSTEVTIEAMLISL